MKIVSVNTPYKTFAIMEDCLEEALDYFIEGESKIRRGSFQFCHMHNPYGPVGLYYLAPFQYDQDSIDGCDTSSWLYLEGELYNHEEWEKGRQKYLFMDQFNELVEKE